MSNARQFNSDQLAFWNGAGGRTWVRRLAHTDVTLAPAFAAFLEFAGPRSGDRVLDVGCGCGASTIDFARAVGPGGRVAALDISQPMLAEAKARSDVAGVSNIDWIEADASVASLEPYDLLVSAFGLMFFGDPVAAFSNLRASAAPEARMAFLCWRTAAENPWIKSPMDAAARHLGPRPPPNPDAPGMFAFADPGRVSGILTSAGWTSPRFKRLDLELDIAAGRGLDEAVVQSTQIGAVNSWLRDQPPEVTAAATASIWKALEPYASGDAVRLPAAMWLVASSAN